MHPDQLVISQCTYPKLERAALLKIFADIGIRKMEGFTDWTASRLDYHTDPQQYIDEAAVHGLTYQTLHLPPLAMTEMDDAAAPEETLAAVDFAGRLGVSVVYFRSLSEDAYRAHGRRVVDACETAGVAPLLEPHDHTPIPDTHSTRRVLDAIGDDRLNVVLELGHLARAGDDWAGFYDAFGGPVDRGGRIASLHFKNTFASGQWAPWREGTVDVPAVLEHFDAAGFTGDIVIESSLDDPEATAAEIDDATGYLAGVLG